jgi:thiol-disulfide isomerase/thioredoxin/uncharacterized membrane protein YphA (DoxX/SURF4 family)
VDEALIAVRLILAGVFVVAGVAKLADLAGSRAAVAGFGVPERLAAPIGTLLPVAEITAAVLLLGEDTARAGALLALVLLAGFCIGIARSMARGEAPDCHCFGQLHSEPVGPRVLIRNLALAALAAFALFAGDDAGPHLLPSFDGSAGALLVAGLAAAILLALGTMAYLQLLRNHGRLLLRVESLEGALRARGIAIPQAEASAPGLPVGTPAPAFNLARLAGDHTSLQDLLSRGKRVLLVFTDPNCVPCRKLAPRLAEWHTEAGDPITLVPISRGAAEPTRAELGDSPLARHILLEEGMEVSQKYKATATPSAVLVDAQGRVASPVAAGDQAILQLARNSIAPALPVVQAGPPPGPKAGDAMPLESQVESLDGEPMSLADALGRRERMLLFWDPNCGFCKRMLPDLLEWEAHNPSLVDDLLVLSKGDPEANEEQGITAQIALDPGTAVGRELKFRGTPSALRVDADGVITSEYAIGADAVMGLARASSASA